MPWEDRDRMGMGGRSEGSSLRTNWICRTNPFRNAGWRRGRPELTQKGIQKPRIVEPGKPLRVDTVASGDIPTGAQEPVLPGNLGLELSLMAAAWELITGYSSRSRFAF